jgi:hypothetical protein
VRVQPAEYEIAARPVVVHPSYDVNYDLSAEPAFDHTPFTGEENAENHAVDGADTPFKMIMTPHEQPSESSQTSTTFGYSKT